MTRINNLTILLVFLLLIFLTGCKSFKLDSAFVSDPIKIDGNYSDWETIPALYFEDQEVLIAASNDSQNLYLAFRFRDPKWLMAIRKTGLTIWLDNTGKKKEQFGVKYSGGPKPQNNMAFERMKKNMPAGQNLPTNQFSDSTKQFAVLNSDWWYKEQHITTDGSFGPKVKYGFENDMYTYEFAVPLDTINEKFYGMNAQTGNEISIGLEFGDAGMKRPDGGGKVGGGEGMTGGRGGGKGGGMGGGRGGGGDRAAMMDNMPSEQKIWIKIKLGVAE